MRSKWPSHAVRRARTKQRFDAALNLARSRGALLDAMIQDKSVSVNEELVSRLSAQVPCLQAQLLAASCGSVARSSAGFVAQDVHVLANAARHQFSESHIGKTASEARKLQRGRPLPPVSADIPPFAFVDDAVVAIVHKGILQEHGYVSVHDIRMLDLPIVQLPQLVELPPPPPPPLPMPPLSQVPSWEPLPFHTYGCIECIGKKPLSDFLDAQASSIAILCGRLDALPDMGATVFTTTGDFDWNIEADPWIPGLSGFRGPSLFQLQVDIGSYGQCLSPLS